MSLGPTSGRRREPHDRDEQRDRVGTSSGQSASAVPPTSREAIAARLRFAREVAGLSQAQAAKLMGLHRPSVSEIEAGRRRVTAEELANFARHYRTSVGWLSGEGRETADPADERIQLAARELSKLTEEDLERVLRVLAAIRARDR